MKLTDFRVRMYKSILDSGWIEVNQLSVVVGKNESGKTTLLKALHKLNPFTPDPYDIKKEWPRGRRGERDEQHEVCRARFELTDEERAELSVIAVLENPTSTIEVGRDYEGNLEVYIDQNAFPDRLHPNDVDEACDALPEVGNGVGTAFEEKAQGAINEAERLAREGQYTKLTELRDTQLPSLKSSLSSNRQAKSTETNFISAYSSALNEVASALEELPTIHWQAHEFVVDRMPTFIYMDDYRAFSGTAALDQIEQRQGRGDLTEEDKTLLTILELSGLELGELVELGKQDPEERQYELSDAAATLTRHISGRLNQRQYEVDFRADGPRFFTFVKDDYDPALIRLEERSKGFQWFFSFDLMFMHESEGTFEGCVILLDEPGLHLHPDAQRDLLARLEHYARGNTLIYTTHLPFMIDLEHPDRIRVLKESEEGVQVTTNLTESPPEAKLVLQAALGMDARQSYLVSEQNIVVEGVDDYWVLTELSNLLRRNGEEGLPNGALITPGGGASEAVYIATFMVGQNLEVVALFDSDQAGRTAKDKLVKSWLTHYNDPQADALLLGDILDEDDDFAVEDLFPEEFFLPLVKEAYGKQMRAQEIEEVYLPQKGMLWNRIERFAEMNSLSFNKGPVAKRLRAKLSSMKDASELPDVTHKRATKLFSALREVFPETEEQSLSAA